jgi:hypothetical protein
VERSSHEHPHQQVYAPHDISPSNTLGHDLTTPRQRCSNIVGCAAVFRCITPADGCHSLLFFGFRKAWRYGGLTRLCLTIGSRKAIFPIDFDHIPHASLHTFPSNCFFTIAAHLPVGGKFQACNAANARNTQPHMFPACGVSFFSDLYYKPLSAFPFCLLSAQCM